MNEHVKKWVAALRSNTYKQGQGVLRVDDHFCCLGVACDLIDPTQWRTHQPDPTKGVFGFGVNESHKYLPDDISALYGISNELELELAELNDNGEIFEQIADYIEEAFANE